MAIGNRLRGKRPPEVVLQVDHLVPVSGGGSDESSNLITSCFECNSGKSDRLLDDRIVIDVQVRNLELENEKLEQLRALNEQNIELRQHSDRIFTLISDIWIGYENPEYLHVREVSGTLRNVIYRYINLLPFDQLVEASELTNQRLMGKSRYDRMRYFSAICRNKVKGIVPPRYGDLT